MTPGITVDPGPVEAGRNDEENVRTGLGVDAIAQDLVDNLHCLQAKLPRHATRNDWYMALAFTVRDRILANYIETLERISNSSSSA